MIWLPISYHNRKEETSICRLKTITYSFIKSKIRPALGFLSLPISASYMPIYKFILIDV